VRKRAEAFAAAAGAASIDEALIMAAEAARDRPSAAAAGPVALAVAPVAVGTSSVATAYPSSFREQFGLLLARSWREATRGKVATFVKVRTRPLAPSILACVVMRFVVAALLATLGAVGDLRRRAVNRAGGAAGVDRGDLRRHLPP
jgi:hypothetical protein